MGVGGHRKKIGDIYGGKCTMVKGWANTVFQGDSIKNFFKLKEMEVREAILWYTRKNTVFLELLSMKKSYWRIINTTSELGR